MRVDVQDEAVLRTIPFHDILSFLTFSEWTVISSIPGFRSVLRKQSNGSSSEVVVPLDNNLDDYAEAVRRILQKVALTDGVSQLDILSRIQSVGSDVVRIRAVHDNFSDGTIPLEGGTALFDGSRALLTAAALAADSPRSVYRGSRPEKVDSFLREARLGQTEVGSYIVTLRTRITPTLHESNLQGRLDLISDVNSEEAQIPFERRVTETLAKALTAAKEAVGISSATHSAKPFEDAVSSGVSANLLDSIIALTDLSGSIETDISVGWSATRAPTQGIPSRVRFLKSEAPLLKEASRILREREPDTNFQLEGIVIGLEADGQASPHIITVRARHNGQWRKVRVLLSESEYQIAIRAHEVWQIVLCEGELVRESRQYTLKSPRNFRLYNDAPQLPFDDDL
jgi:hypothetical protein